MWASEKSQRKEGYVGQLVFSDLIFKELFFIELSIRFLLYKKNQNTELFYKADENAYSVSDRKNLLGLGRTATAEKGV